ncbi:MAG: flippase [bacterium]
MENETADIATQNNSFFGILKDRQALLAYLKSKWADKGFQKYFKNTGWLFSTKIISLLISFATTAIVARQLGPGNYGQLSYAISFVGLLSFLYSLGIDNVLYRDLIKYPEKKNEFLGSAFAIKMVTGILTAIVITISALFFVADDVSLILIFILSATFIFNSFQVISYEFQSRVLSKYPSIISVVIALVLNILKILVIYLGKGVIYLAVILLLESILYAIAYWIIYEAEIGRKVIHWRFNKDVTISLLKDSWPLIFTGVFAMVYARIDQVFIKHMIDAHAVGIYDSAVRLTEVWYFIPNIVVASFFPAIVNAKMTSTEVYRGRLIKLALLLLFVSIIIALPVTFLAPFIIKIIYGAAFAGSAIILQIYIWSNVGTFLSNLATNYLIAENKRATLFIFNLIPMIINVILNLWWIPIYGIVGSAYATLISYSIGPIFLVFIKYDKVIPAIKKYL